MLKLSEEGGKRQLAEALWERYKFNIRCGTCPGNPGKQGFIKDQAGKAAEGAFSRRYWTCQRSNGQKVTQRCGRVSCSEFIDLAITQLGPSRFDVVVQSVTERSSLSDAESSLLQTYRSEFQQGGSAPVTPSAKPAVPLSKTPSSQSLSLPVVDQGVGHNPTANRQSNRDPNLDEKLNLTVKLGGDRKKVESSIKADIWDTALLEKVDSPKTLLTPSTPSCKRKALDSLSDTRPRSSIKTKETWLATSRSSEVRLDGPDPKPILPTTPPSWESLREASNHLKALVGISQGWAQELNLLTGFLQSVSPTAVQPIIVSPKENALRDISPRSRSPTVPFASSSSIQTIPESDWGQKSETSGRTDNSSLLERTISEEASPTPVQRVQELVKHFLHLRDGEFGDTERVQQRRRIRRRARDEGLGSQFQVHLLREQAREQAREETLLR